MAQWQVKNNIFGMYGLGRLLSIAGFKFSQLAVGS